jgi:uncharacterized membrane protein
MNDLGNTAPGPNRAIEREVRRTEFFSDGVMAIGMTLLVLNLSVSSYHRDELSAQLRAQWPTYVAFALSFTFVAVMWMNHHAVFDRLRALSFAVQWANMGILLGAVILNYPTVVLASAFQSGSLRDEKAAIVLYCLMAFFMGLCWEILFLIVWRTPRLWKYESDEPKWRRVSLWGVGGAFGYLIVLLVGEFVNPWLAGLLIFLLVLYRASQAPRIARSTIPPSL